MTYVIAVEWTARVGEEDEVARCARALIAPTRREPGNLMYQPHRDPTDPRVIYIYEQYVDESQAGEACCSAGSARTGPAREQEGVSDISERLSVRGVSHARLST